MAIQGNFKGTTQPGFQVGKRGITIHGTASPADPSDGDLWIDKTTKTIKIYDSNSTAWENSGKYLTDLNVDNGTLFVDSTNDTVSIGSETSNEKLFVNGNLRLGTNPSLQHSGAYIDMRHSNGSTTAVRIRDNTSNTNPIFKVFSANNTSEVFTVNGNVTIHGYTMPVSDGTNGQVIVTDGAGNLSFSTVSGSGIAYTDLSVTDAGGMGSMSYNNTNGVFTYTGPSNVEVRGAFTAGHGIVISSGEISTPKYTEKTANVTLTIGERVIVDTSTANVTLTLPASPTLGDEVRIIDGAFNAATNNITVNGNGANIDGSASNYTIDVNGAAFGLVYYNTGRGWIFTER